MANLVKLVVLIVLAATASALENHGRNLQECKSLVPSNYTLKPSKTRAPVVDLEWVGADDQTIFAITYNSKTTNGGLWHSKDGGAVFEDFTPRLGENTSIFNIFNQKSDPNNMLFLGTGYHMWVSRDRGLSLEKVEYPGKVQGMLIRDLRFNPRRDTWLLMHVRRASCKVKDQAHQECPRDIMLNKDVFKNPSDWTNLTERTNGALAGFVDFDWGANLCPGGNCTDLPPIPDELILATAYARAEDYDKSWDEDVNFVTSVDFFGHHTTQIRCGNQLEIVGRSVYLAVANGCPSSPDGSPLVSSRSSYSSITLFTSMDAGSSFARACLPGALKQDGYELVETHDGRGALVVVEFTVDRGMMMGPLYAASVYAAGPHHALFSMSLTNVVNSEAEGTTDFTRLEGVSGVYIANQRVPRPSTDGSAGSIDPTPDLPAMDYYMYDSYYDMSEMMGDPLIETRITYSGGGRWQRIRVNASRIKSPVCRGSATGTVYLHLNGVSSIDGLVTLPGVYSNPAAPGLVLATGNVASLGSGLDPTSPGLCTWLSRDGGVTWEDVAEGPYIFEFADWGGVIVMAKYATPLDRFRSGVLATEVLFSMDYGACWHNVPLEAPLYVDNIRIEPDGQRAVVIVHGRATLNESLGLAGTEGLMYTLNLTELINLPACGSADFGTWFQPNANFTGRRCVLGKQMSYTRRNQGSLCFQGSEYKRPAPSNVTLCKCTKLMDTECDYGFLRNNDTCVAINNSVMPVCPVVEHGSYKVSSTGLRMVHGDNCTDRTGIIPDTNGQGEAIPGRRTSTGGSGWVTALVLLLVVGLLVGGGFVWWRYRATDEQQETVRELAGNAAAAVASVWWLMVDKIRSIRFRSSSRSAFGGGAAGEEMGYFQPLGSDPGYDVEGRGTVFTLK